MQISPRYDDGALIRMDGEPSDVCVPLVRQRRRLGKILASFSAEQWATPSRCDGWRVQDVVAHLVGTNAFWNASITQGVAGLPTRMLAAFDPKATPNVMVESVRERPFAETLASYIDSCEVLCATVESLDDAGWKARAESPAGHVGIDAVAHHALWDAWIHERDILEPLGIQQDDDPDEVVACLRYAAAINPALALQLAPERSGALVIDATTPMSHVVITVDGSVHVGDGPAPTGALVLTGDAHDLIESLSVRTQWAGSVPTDQAWLVRGLQEVFETSM